MLEVNPRSSRTVPFLSKITDIQMAQLAMRAIMGETLAEMGSNKVSNHTLKAYMLKRPYLVLIN